MASLSRWTVFLILSCCMFAYYYTYDIPVALQEQLQEEYDINNVQYTLLFSAYSWPNVVIPILVGILTDKIGVNPVIVVVFTMAVVGNAIFVAGIYYGHYALMLAGRVVYGIGIESFAMAETPLLYEYFKGKELSFALGANLSFSLFGSSVCQQTTFWFYNIDPGEMGIFYASLAALLIIAFCWILLSGLILHRVLFNTGNLRFGAASEKDALTTTSNGYGTASNGYGTSSADQSPTQSIPSFNSTESRDRTLRGSSMDSDYGPSGSVTIRAVAHHDGDAFEETSVPTKREENDEGDAGAAEDEKFRLSDITSFNVRFWILIVVCCLIEGAVEPFLKIGGSFMQSVLGFSHQKANQYLSVPYLTSGILTPIVGYAVDRFGYRCHILAVSTVVLCAVHSVFLNGLQLEGLNAACLVLLGFSYSTYSGVIWPAFAVVVDPKTIGTAYGISVAGYNLSLAIFFLVIGVLAGEAVDDEDEMADIDSHRYRDVLYLLLSMAGIAVLMVAWLWREDSRTGWHLKLPTIAHKRTAQQYVKLEEQSDGASARESTSSIGLAKFN